MPALNASTYQQIYGDTQPIAVIGAGCRFPRADDIFEYWQRLADGEELIDFFDADRLAAAGIDPALLNRPGFVPAGAVLDRTDRFEWEFFGYSRQEAESIDPQQRFFLMCAWEALEMAGYRPGKIDARVGVIGAAKMSTYMSPAADDLHNIASPLVFQKLIGNDKDYLATRTAYKLGLTGPALTVQTACSSSLVATHLACEQLASGESDMVLAGGVGIAFPQESGYLHRAGMIFSPDGRCRPFDAAAQGTTIGNGAAVVLLKRLERALEDGDPVLAVIRGSAINNDGGLKAGFTAPSVEGQRRVISEALELADVDPSTIGLVEAHGTATPLGDPIEVAALTQAWSPYAPTPQSCALGSVKSNLGHLDTAAGIASFLKAAMAVWHAQIPPSLHFETPNPAIDFGSSPFFVPQMLQPWPDDKPARRAAVSSFGIGGTNSHIVIENAPCRLQETAAKSKHKGKPLHLLLSARDEDGLRALAKRHIARLSDPESAFDATAYAATSFHHRTLFLHRLLLAADDAGGWIDLLYAFVDGDETRINALPADDGIVAWHAGIKDADAAALIAAAGSGNPDWTKWIAPPATRALLPVAPFGGERCWRNQTDSAAPAAENTFNATQTTDSRNPAATASWEALLAEGHRRAGELADSIDLSGLAEEGACIDALHTCYVSRAFEQLGVFGKTEEWLNVDEFLAKTRIPARYRDLAERLLRDLAASGALQRRSGNDGNRYGMLQKTAIDHENWLARMRASGYRNLASLIERTGPQLAGMLTGTVDPVSAVFPAASTDDVEHMYREQPYSVYFNRIASAAAAALARHGAAPLRILEIGAGTGGTTRDVLQSLPSGSCANYTFTDIGPLFLQRAKQKFAAYPFMEYASFDIEKAAPDQPLPCGQYDLIIAANVLHNASDLRRMLVNLGSLLAPDGVLMMREITVPKKLFDFVFGPLVPPIGDTASRDGELFASLRAWNAALRDAGFVACDAFPGENLPTAALGEHIIAARWPGVTGHMADASSSAAAQRGSPPLFVAANRHEASNDSCPGWTPGRLLGAVLKTIPHTENVILEDLRWHADPCGAPDPLPLLVDRDDTRLDVRAALPDGTLQKLFDARIIRSRSRTPMTPRTNGTPYGHLVPDCNGTPFDHAISAIRSYGQAWPSRIGRLAWPAPSLDDDLRHYDVYRDGKRLVLAAEEQALVSLDDAETVAALPQPWRDNGTLYRWQWQPFALPETAAAAGKLLLVGNEQDASVWVAALRQSGYQVDTLPTLDNLPAALLATYAEAVTAVCWIPPSLFDAGDAAGILAAQQHQLMELATLLKTLAQAAASRPASLPVAVLTAGVCTTGPDDTLDNYLSAGLDGLLNVARHEFRTLAPLLIDQGDATPQEVAADFPALLCAETPRLAQHRSKADTTVRWRQSRLIRQTVTAPAPLAAGRHVIVGALSPLGLALIESLATQGATELILLTRREPHAAETAQLERLKAAGIAIEIDSRADAADPAVFEAALTRLTASDKPIAGIFHLAGVLHDEALADLREESLQSALAPKLLPAILLHRWEKRLRPAQTVYFSSAATAFGPSGQGAHAATNAVLEALAQHRSQQGHDTVALAWGYWDITTTGNDRGLASHLRQRGMEAMPAAQALSLLTAACAGDAAVYAPMRVDWPRLAAAAVSPADLAPFAALTGKTESAAANSAPPQNNSASRKPVLQQNVNHAENDNRLREKLRRLIAAVLHCPPEKITGNVNLVSLGLDSLLFLELSQRLQKELGVTVNAETAFKANTLDTFVEALAPSAASSSSPATSVPDPQDDLYRRVRNMLAEVLHCPPEQISGDANLVSLGLDSLLFLELSQRLQKELGVTVNAETAFKANTLKAFVAALEGSLPEQSFTSDNAVYMPDTNPDIATALLDADDNKRPLLARTYLRQRISAQLHCDENSLADESNLVQLGLDSLLFLELSETVSRELGVRMNAETAFRAGTLGALADAIAEALPPCGRPGRENADIPAKSRSSEIHPPVLDAAQKDFSLKDDGLRDALNELHNDQGSWLAENGDVLPRGATAESVPLTGLQRSRWLSRNDVARHLYVEYDKPADFDVDAFEAAWNRVIARHPFMRATIDADSSIRTLQRVEKYVIPRFDWRDLPHGQQTHERAALRTAMSRQTLDLGRWPHFDLRVSRIDDDYLRIHLDIDTTLIDIESFQIILRELHLAMTEPQRTLPPLGFSPLDYQAALLALAKTPTAKRQNDAIADEIAALPPPPDMPLLNRMSSRRGTDFLIWREALPRAQWLALKAHAENESLSGTAVLLAAYGLALRQWTTRSAFTLRLDYTDRQPLHAQVMNIVLDATASMPVGLDLQQAASFTALAKQCADAITHRLTLPLADSDTCLRHYADTHGQQGKGADALPVAFTSLLGVRRTYAIPETSDPLLGMPSYEYAVQPHTGLHLQALEEESALLFNIDAVKTLFPDELGETLLLTLKRLLETLADLPEAWSVPLAELLPVDAQISAFTESALQRTSFGEIEETA